MKKLLVLIMNISTVLLSFAMEQDPELQWLRQEHHALKYIDEHNLGENCNETAYRLLEAIAKKDISEMNAIIENFPAQARPILLNSVKNDYSKIIAYPHLYECYKRIMQGDNYFLLTPLIVAVMAADEKILEALFEYGVHIDVNKESLVKMAVKCNPNAIPLLVRKSGESIDKALYDAAAEGHIVTAQQLLKIGANVNSKDNKSQLTPLQVACYKNHCDIVKLLLEKGALVDQADSMGWTLLHSAAGDGKFAVAKLLLEHGANVNIREKFSQQTPSHVAYNKGHLDMMKLLLEKGALVDQTDSLGWTLLHRAAWDGKFAIASLLLEHGANVNSKDSDSQTPLDFACDKNHADMVKLLLEKGALVDETDSLGKTPLQRAFGYSNFSMVDLLLKNGAFVDQRDPKGRTLLHLAVLYGNFSMVNLLLEHGAKLDSNSGLGLTPLHVACQMGRNKIVELLLKKAALVDEIDSAGRTPLHWAVQDGEFSIASLLLERGASVNRKDSKSQTPLHIACDKNHDDIVKLLLEKGALIDETDSAGGTSLHRAAWNGNFAIANVLLEHGANVNRKSKSQLTPLLLACHKGSPAMVKLLLEKGAFVDGTDRNGQTPLHVAVQKNNFSLVDLLLEHGANIGAKDKDGGTVIECISKAPAGVRAMELLRWGAPYPTTQFHQEMLEKGNFGGKLEGSYFFYQNYFRALIKGDTQGALAAITQASGNDFNQATEKMAGLTVLHWAVLQNNLKVVQALIVKSIAKSNILQTIASYIPIISGHAKVSSLVNLNCRDIGGRTPLMWAARLGYADIYCDLVKAGAQTALRDKKGKMAVNYAADYRNVDIIREMIIDGTLSAKPVTNSN